METTVVFCTEKTSLSVFPQWNSCNALGYIVRLEPGSESRENKCLAVSVAADFVPILARPGFDLPHGGYRQ